MNQPRIILASASPRRKDLLKQIGVEYAVMVSDKEEKPVATDPEGVCRELAVMKAIDVAEKAQEIFAGIPLIIIGADTVVACGGDILGKPKDRDDAAAMLSEISGRTHQVYTGVCAIYCGGAEELKKEAVEIGDSGFKGIVFADCTDVTVAPLSEEAIDDYLATGEPFDKAGAYGIQGYFARYVEKIDGDYHNVVGLPVGRVYRECLSFVE